MFNRESILKSLNSENYYVDKHSLDLFLNDWKIDSIYEDEDGLEFYDDLALERIKKGISLKAQGYSDEQIISKLQRIEPKVEKPTEPVQPILVRDYLEETAQEEQETVTDLTPMYLLSSSPLISLPACSIPSISRVCKSSPVTTVSSGNSSST